MSATNYGDKKAIIEAASKQVRDNKDKKSNFDIGPLPTATSEQLQSSPSDGALKN